MSKQFKLLVFLSVLAFEGVVLVCLPSGAYSQSNDNISTFLFAITDSPDSDALIPSLSKQRDIPAERLSHGRYMFQLARCNSCHNSQNDKSSEVNLFGGAPSLKFAKNYSDVDLVRAIRSGVNNKGEDFDRTSHKGFFWMSDNDAYSIVYYLRSLFDYNEDKQFSDHFESSSYKVGYIPSTPKSQKKEYGKYLVESVAQCTICHSKEGGLFTSGNRLGGKKIFNLNKEEVLAPSIKLGEEEMSFDDFALLLISKCPIEAWQVLESNDTQAIYTYLNSVK